jgi:alpha/beta superfamily hydrolase
MKLQHSMFILSAFGLLGLVAAQDALDDPILLLSKDESFHFQLLDTLGVAIYSGSDIGPVLKAARDIVPGDFDSFSEVFHNLANETKAQAEDVALAYDPVNVRDVWFSAATYFRRADFYLHTNPDNPLINSLWDEQLAAFNKGLAALPIPGKRIQIPADNFTVEAIWYTPSLYKCKRPTLILSNGYDGSQEDLYHTIVVPILARGWNALTYEGPGQPTVRRKQNIGFIHDWERALTPVVDWLFDEHSDVVDQDRLALFGYSFGGYLAARAAAFEPRVSAVVLSGGIWSTFDSFAAMLPSELLDLFKAGEKEAFDEQIQAVRGLPDISSSLKWGIDQGLWSFNFRSPFDFLESTKLYTIKDIVHQIKVPVWIGDGEADHFFAGQGQLVKEALGDQATLHIFRESAGYHCQVGALQELTRTVFAWLNKTLPPK